MSGEARGREGEEELEEEEDKVQRRKSKFYVIFVGSIWTGASLSLSVSLSMCVCVGRLEADSAMSSTEVVALFFFF